MTNFSLVRTTPINGSSPSAKRRLFAAPAVVIAALGLAVLGALPAQAAVSNPVDGSKVSNGGSIKVEGKAPEGASVYGIGSCNTTAETGTACNNGSGRTAIAELKSADFSASVKVDAAFDNYNFLERKSGSGKTKCLNAAKDNGGAQCAIEVVYYAKNAKGDYVPMGTPDVVKIYVD